MNRIIDTLRRLGIGLRPHEVGIASALFGYSLLVGIFQFSSKAVRQATFVDAVGAEQLPKVYLLVALIAYPTMRIYNRFADRFSRGSLVAITSLLIAASLAIFWWLMASDRPWVAYGYYLFISIATVLALSQLWSYTGSILDLRQARRLFGFIGSGSLLGGVVGGQVTRFASAGEPRNTLLVGAAVVLAMGAVALALDRRSSTRRTLTGRALGKDSETSRSGAAATHGLTVLFRSSHLMVIAAILALAVLVSQVIDLQFSWVVEQHTTDLADRGAVFGNMFSVMGLAAFLFQILFTSRIHQALGVGFAMRVLPAFVVLTSLAMMGSAALGVGLIWVISSLKIGETGLRYSLDHVTRELLFVAVPPAERAAAKSYVDVVVHRFAKGTAAILLLPVTFGWITVLQVTWLTLALCAVWLLCTYRAHRQYVSSLRAGLVSGGRDLPDTAVLLDLDNVTTLEVLVESLGSADPEQVLNGIELLARNGRAHLVPPLLLYHDSSRVRRRTLQALIQAKRDDALPLVERCLGDEVGAVRASAIQALSALSGTAAPSLMVSRVDDSDPRVRSAAIACLLTQGDPTTQSLAVSALEELMTDADPSARRHSAQALGEVGDPRFDSHMVRLLFDNDPGVVRAAIESVRRRAEAGSASPLFPPILISLLRNRRLKHDAREALAAFGDDVVPALAHFLNSESEQIWVRRALPKTIVHFGGERALDALFECLDQGGDPMLRRKSIEALARVEGLDHSDPRIERMIVTECQRYSDCIFQLSALADGLDLHGPLLSWSRPPTLLERVLDERRLDHFHNLMRLLALGDDGEGVRRAHRRLLGDSAELRLRAIEYLDNVVADTVRGPLLLVIDDLPETERVELGRRLFGLERRSRSDVLDRLLKDVPEEEEGEAWLVAAAIYEASNERASTLFPRLRELAQAKSGLVRETAQWAIARA